MLLFCEQSSQKLVAGLTLTAKALKRALAEAAFAVFVVLFVSFVVMAVTVVAVVAFALVAVVAVLLESSQWPSVLLMSSLPPGFLSMIGHPCFVVVAAAAAVEVSYVCADGLGARTLCCCLGLRRLEVFAAPALPPCPAVVAVSLAVGLVAGLAPSQLTSVVAARQEGLAG